MFFFSENWLSFEQLLSDLRGMEVDEAVAAVALGLEIHGQIEEVEPPGDGRASSLGICVLEI